MTIEFREHHTLRHPFQLQVRGRERWSDTCVEMLRLASINTFGASSTNWSSHPRIRISTR